MHARLALALVAWLACAYGPALITAATCAQLQADLKFPHCVELAENGTYSLAWKTSSTNIWLAIDVDNPDPNGFAGIGLSEAGGMKAADIAVVSRSAAQQGLQVIDLWSEANARPDKDVQQDVVLVAPLVPGQQPDLDSPGLKMSPAAGRIRALLRRPLNSCDSKQDISITPGLPQHVIWSYGQNWPSYHGRAQRGETVINFIPLTGDEVQPSPPGRLEKGAKQLDILMPNVTIPAKETSYLCTHVQLPDDKKYHIIARQALVKSPLVHHMILYACTSPRPPAGDLFDCLGMEAECSTFTLGWAPGQDYVEFGPEAGFPFGKATPTDPVPNWFALQTHYNNPEQVVTTMPDTSGMRITYTDRLRPNDMGVITLIQRNLYIPPGLQSFAAEPSLCPGECTSKLDRNLTMSTTMMHMHQIGATITTRHFRGKKELEPLGHRSVWNFNYQGTAPIPFSTRQLLPGDSLVTQCTYDSSTRTNVTWWGEGSMDEMCIDFVTYYPKVNNLAFCTTQAGANNDKAVCGSLSAIAQAVSDPAKAQAKLQAAGLLVNATWPKGYVPWTDPLCPNNSGIVPLV